MERPIRTPTRHRLIHNDSGALPATHVTYTTISTCTTIFPTCVCRVHVVVFIVWD